MLRSSTQNLLRSAARVRVAAIVRGYADQPSTHSVTIREALNMAIDEAARPDCSSL